MELKCEGGVINNVFEYSSNRTFMELKSVYVLTEGILNTRF